MHFFVQNWTKENASPENGIIYTSSIRQESKKSRNHDQASCCNFRQYIKVMLQEMPALLTLTKNHFKQLTYHHQNEKPNLSQKSPVLIPGKEWVLEGFMSC